MTTKHNIRQKSMLCLPESTTCFVTVVNPLVVLSFKFARVRLTHRKPDLERINVPDEYCDRAEENCSLERARLLVM